jgi:hypothetical protein
VRTCARGPSDALKAGHRLAISVKKKNGSPLCGPQSEAQKVSSGSGSAYHSSQLNDRSQPEPDTSQARLKATT